MKSNGREHPTPVFVVTRLTLLLGIALATVAGVQLYLFSDRTADLFAWTIGVPLTAAFVGAGYWSTLPSLGLALRIREWQLVRLLLVAVLVFCLFIALATLRHLNLFHFSGPGLIARGRHGPGSLSTSDCRGCLL